MFGIKISHKVETKKKRQRLQSGKVEETKINFFDPNVYGEQEAPYEKPVEDQIIEARFDPVDWRAELDRVDVDLNEVEKDVQLAFGYSGALPEEIEECKRHYDMIERECHEIRAAIN